MPRFIEARDEEKRKREMSELHEIIRDLKKENRNIREEIRHIRSSLSMEKPKNLPGVDHLPGESKEVPRRPRKSHDEAGPSSYTASREDGWPLDGHN